MGLGKTYTGSEKLHDLGGQVNLVICQKSKISDWVDHFQSHYNYEVYDLSVMKECERFVESVNERVGIINYDIIFRRKQISQMKINTLMLDESSIIQNRTSKRSKAILKIDAENVILLSGTPTGGKYERLWSQVKLLGWGISEKMFMNQFVNYHYDSNEGFPILIIDGYKNEDRLKRKLREHGCHFLKTEDVFDLPDQIHNTIRVKSSKLYWRFKKDRIVNVGDVELIGDTILTKMLYERQLCGAYSDDKLDAFSDLVESTSDRLIVFYNFNAELDQMMKLVGDRPVSQVNGHVKDLTSYENDENSITFIQHQSGSMGLNLQKSNKIIYFTPPLSSEMFEQSKKRTHRIGQDKTCFYYYIVCRGSVEERIYKTLEMRKDYTDALFEMEE